jgi:hypothetical protein
MSTIKIIYLITTFFAIAGCLYVIVRASIREVEKYLYLKFKKEFDKLSHVK